MKKLDLGGIQSAPSTARSAHPTVEVTDEETLALLTQFTQVNPQYKMLKNQSETLRTALSGRIKTIFFGYFKGREAETSTMLVRIAGKTVKLITKNVYSKTLTDDKPLIAALGQDIVTHWFRQATVLKLELDKAPEDQQEAFANGVIALAQKLGVMDAVSASQCIQPKAGFFHEARTSLLSPEQNAALDALMPITAYPML